MKNLLFALLLSVVMFGCQNKEVKKVIVPRVLIANEEFNAYQKPNTDSLTIFQTKEEDSQVAAEKDGEKFRVKYGDSVISIQINKNDPASVADQFSFAKYINSQKTCLLVQTADSTGLVAPFYIISLTSKGTPEVVSLYRASNGSQDGRFTKGLAKVGRTGYLINNDFFVTNVNSKVYLIKRINPEERIQGLFFIQSQDKATLVFLVGSSFYEVHYPTNEVFTQPLAASVPKEPAALFKWVQDNYSWRKNKSGITFLMENKDDNRIIDISEFKN
jgi:hypothetical protein